jgi:hypothetical protein
VAARDHASGSHPKLIKISEPYVPKTEIEDGGNFIMRNFLILLLTGCIRTGVNRTEHGDDEKWIQNFILATIREKKNTQMHRHKWQENITIDTKVRGR